MPLHVSEARAATSPAGRLILRWIALGAVVGAACGCSSASFLWLLELVTSTRRAHDAWVWALPIAGLALGAALERLGPSVEGGTSLILDRAHDGGAQVPVAMAPVVLLGSVATHLFGGSAGREGAAVQAGAALADSIAHRARATPALRRQLLVAGVAGGFGSVFGTPLAGAIFGLEIVVRRRLRVRAIVPALVASLVGDWVTRRLGITHAAYPAVAPLLLDARALERWAVFAAVVAAAAALFLELRGALARAGARLLPRLPLRMCAGAIAVVALWRLAGTDAYLGLGVPTILAAFEPPGPGAGEWAWKLVFTAVTLGAGFLGGEVTPLFFVGATLGGALARGLGLPVDLGAGVGMAALFAAASGTPLALSMLAVELLGVAAMPHVLLVCIAATLLMGKRGLYSGQRIVTHDARGHDLAVPLRALDQPRGR
ncbi:MAG: chloride channel protein [Polyangiaceae bacterium]|nr:chloride channel protein [Polyangiaceae bacterium]